MKKIILCAVLLCTMAACSSKETVPPSFTEKTETATTAATNVTSNSGGESGFAIPTLNSYDKFPSADYWTALGLPSDFTIDIIEMEFSPKNSIYPLN